MMTYSELKEILDRLGCDHLGLVVRGRDNPEVSCSVSGADYARLVAQGFPPGWRRAQESRGYYPEGTVRVIWKGE